MEKHWIPINYDDNTRLRLVSAVRACHRVHAYTVETLNDYFIDHAESYPLSSFRYELALFLSDHKDSLTAQHYALTKAAEKSFPYFTENKKINGDGKFIPVKPILLQDYSDIQIESRRIWRKYLALNDLITTAYGTLYLDNATWMQTVEAQATEKNVTFEAVPFLWHSVTVRVDLEEPKLRFNLHEPDSKFSKLQQQGMRYYVH